MGSIIHEHIQGSDSFPLHYYPPPPLSEPWHSCWFWCTSDRAEPRRKESKGVELRGLWSCFNRLELSKVRNPDDPFIKVFKKGIGLWRNIERQSIAPTAPLHTSSCRNRLKKTVRGEKVFSSLFKKKEKQHSVPIGFRKVLQNCSILYAHVDSLQRM